MTRSAGSCSVPVLPKSFWMFIFFQAKQLKSSVKKTVYCCRKKKHETTYFNNLPLNIISFKKKFLCLNPCNILCLKHDVMCTMGQWMKEARVHSHVNRLL